MNLLFNPSYLKVSAGRRGTDVAHSFTARFPGEPLLPSPALFPDALTLTPSAPSTYPGKGTHTGSLLPDPLAPPSSLLQAELLGP